MIEDSYIDEAKLLLPFEPFWWNTSVSLPLHKYLCEIKRKIDIEKDCLVDIIECLISDPTSKNDAELDGTYFDDQLLNQDTKTFDSGFNMLNVTENFDRFNKFYKRSYINKNTHIQFNCRYCNNERLNGIEIDIYKKQSKLFDIEIPTDDVKIFTDDSSNLSYFFADYDKIMNVGVIEPYENVYYLHPFSSICLGCFSKALLKINQPYFLVFVDPRIYTCLQGHDKYFVEELQSIESNFLLESDSKQRLHFKRPIDLLNTLERKHPGIRGSKMTEIEKIKSTLLGEEIRRHNEVKKQFWEISALLKESGGSQEKCNSVITASCRMLLKELHYCKYSTEKVDQNIKKSFTNIEWSKVTLSFGKQCTEDIRYIKTTRNEIEHAKKLATENEAVEVVERLKLLLSKLYPKLAYKPKSIEDIYND